MPFQEVFLSPFVLALFGLCIGSFLNVVIHRLPLMLERGWKMESADLLGVAHEATPAITLSTVTTIAPNPAACARCTSDSISGRDPSR